MRTINEDGAAALAYKVDSPGKIGLFMDIMDHKTTEAL